MPSEPLRQGTPYTSRPPSPVSKITTRILFEWLTCWPPHRARLPRASEERL
jgi:hypothetical protein